MPGIAPSHWKLYQIFFIHNKVSPNLIVEVCPVYGGQKQVGAFGCIFIVRFQNVEFHNLQLFVRHNLPTRSQDTVKSCFTISSSSMRTFLRLFPWFFLGAKVSSSLISIELIGGVTHIILLHVSGLFGTVSSHYNRRLQCILRLTMWPNTKFWM